MGALHAPGDVRSPLLCCERPFMVDGKSPVRCGRCRPCRVAVKQEWVNRAEFEHRRAGVSSFVTLTYDEPHLPADRSVSRPEIRAFLQRLRKRLQRCGDARLSSVRFRPWGPAEYGERFGRPHYHVILFGLDPCLVESHVKAAWVDGVGDPKGNVHVGLLDRGGISYVAQYCVKHMTSKRDDRLDGRAPEFMVYPSRPPLGAGLVDGMFQALNTPAGLAKIAELGDVPGVVRMEGREVPIGRTLRRRLRKMFGLDSELHTQARVKAWHDRVAKAVELLGSDQPGAGVAFVDRSGIDVRAARAKFYSAAKRGRSI